MIFGKIDYLNLLPFHIFIKRHLRTTRLHATIAYKKGVPSCVNAAFKKRTINAAFISSIESKKYPCVDLGIISNKEVDSVLVLEGHDCPDSASATSNALAKVLNIHGQVLIGDAALKYTLSGGKATDLSLAWYEKHHLPFVFARLCYHKKASLVKKLASQFTKHKQRIPHYLMQHASKKSGVPVNDIKVYLDKIYYKIQNKEKKSLEKFLHQAKKHH